MFTKKANPADRPLPERAKALRKAVYDAMQANGISGHNAANVLDDIAKGERVRLAYTAPLASATPKVHSGNVPPGPVDKLKAIIAGW